MSRAGRCVEFRFRSSGWTGVARTCQVRVKRLLGRRTFIRCRDVGLARASARRLDLEVLDAHERDDGLHQQASCEHGVLPLEGLPSCGQTNRWVRGSTAPNGAKRMASLRWAPTSSAPAVVTAGHARVSHPRIGRGPGGSPGSGRRRAPRRVGGGGAARVLDLRGLLRRVGEVLDALGVAERELDGLHLGLLVGVLDGDSPPTDVPWREWTRLDRRSPKVSQATDNRSHPM